MKVNFFILVISILFSGVTFSQNAFYKEGMEKNIRLFRSAKSANDFTKVAKAFESLSIVSKNDWLAYYYASLCNALAAFEKPASVIDHLCDKADVLANRADSLSKNNSEVMVLKSMIAAARIKVNKAQRGQKYGLMATKLAIEAVKLNDSNPRGYFVKAKAILNTPASLGGGEKKAKPVFELALEKLKVFKSESSFHPSWGKEETESELKKMNTKMKK
jgi:hypothetical protein